MTIVQDRWQLEQCRIEDGIYFPDDTYVPLRDSRPAGQRMPIVGLLERSPEGWGAIYPGPPLCVSVHLWVSGGDTAWEGAGFLALGENQTGQLRWLLHCSTSEPFATARIEAGCIVATSGGYPKCRRWRIPVAAPWNLELLPDK